MKYYVVSDVHDHFDLMVGSLKEQGFDPADDDHKLIVCGDAFYSGPQPGETYAFLREMESKNKLVFIKGNHDVDLLDNLKNDAFARPANRRCAAGVVEYTTGKNGLSDREIIEECKRIGFCDFLEKVPVWYYETGHYIFTHAFIPTDRNTYKPGWRSSSDKEWRAAASRGDAMMLTLRHHVGEPGKIIVCGHYSTARFYMMKNASPDDWNKRIYKDVSLVPPEGFKPFYGNGVIAIDGSVKKTGFVNCIVIED